MESEPEREWPRAADQPDPAAWEPVSPEISRRVSAILDAVDREAASLRQEAREEARRHMQYSRRRADALVAERQRQISELSDDLIARAERMLRHLEDAEPIRAGFEELVRRLGETAERLALGGDDYADFAPPPFHETPAAPPRAEWAAPPTGGGPSERSWQEPDGAQLVTIQMAAAGCSRAQVGVYLRDSMSIADPGSVLDEVFGPGSSDDARVPWAKPAAR